MTERTFSIIKPDATRRNLTGKINQKFEDAGLRIVAQKRIQLSPAQAGKFYEVHKDRPFYGELVESMVSAPVVARERGIQIATTRQEAGGVYDGYIKVTVVTDELGPGGLRARLSHQHQASRARHTDQPAPP